MSKSASEYHRQTSYSRHRMSGHHMDWENQPEPFKHYRGLEEIRLPVPDAWPGRAQSELFAERQDVSGPLSLEQLALVLALTHAITATARHAGKEFYYRSVASAGALYPFELYLATQGVDGLPDGLYHHSAATRSLALLREGRLDDALGRILPSSPTPRNIRFFVTSIFFRSSWKYRDRAYRYYLIDSGHLLENLTHALRMAGLSFNLTYDFNDSAANEFLCVDPNREACLAVCPAGAATESKSGDDVAAVRCSEDLEKASRVAESEIDYPEIREFHASTCAIATPQSSGSMLDLLGLQALESMTIDAPARNVEILSYPEAVFHRRSLRNLVPDEMGGERFQFLLNLMCQDADSSGRPFDHSLVVGFLAARVEGLTPGFYTLDRRRASTNLIRKGAMVEAMARISLDQMWLANCAAHFLFMADLSVIDAKYGPRGYRYAMLNAGRLGQRLYVAATSLKLGCCGIGAFYDDEAADLLGLGAGGRLLYLVGVGPVKKLRNQPI
jgi:SagB-type dehydrogenase family enzyme